MMTAVVQEGLAKHFSDIHQLTDVLVLRTDPALLKVSETFVHNIFIQTPHGCTCTFKIRILESADLKLEVREEKNETLSNIDA